MTQEVLVRRRHMRNRWVPMRAQKLRGCPPTMADIDREYPVHPPAYTGMKPYGDGDDRVTEAWTDGGVNDYIDHPPLELLMGDPELVNRCTWWRGTVRRGDQDVFTFRGKTWTVVQLVWERAWGPVDGWMLSPQICGWDQKPMFARPQCGHYTDRGICCNALHYKLEPRTGRGATVLPEHVGDILLRALDGRTAREIAGSLGLPVEPVRRRITALRRDHPAIAQARQRRSQHEKGSAR